MNEISTYPMTVLALGAIAFGVYLLVKGGDWTIDAAGWVAEKSGLSPMFIAATIVAFGTSAPELFTSINANLTGYPAISLGNVVGSNIANILMVLGIAAIVAPIMVSKSEVRVDVVMMIVATAILAGGMIYGVFPRIMALGMLAILVGYIFYQYRANRLIDEEDDDGDEEPQFQTKKAAILTLFAGLVTLVIGSELLVQGAIVGGVAIGVPEAVIAMTVIAFGTSLPELSTSITAARKGKSDMIIGGLLGSNIFNILSIVAFSSLARPLVADERFLGFDLPVVILVTIVFAALLLMTGRFGRITGIVFLGGYLAFVAYQYLGAFVPGLESASLRVAG